MRQEATNGCLEDSGGRNTLSLSQLEVIPEEREEREKTANCFRLFCWPRAGHSGSSEIGKRVPKKQKSVPVFGTDLVPKTGGQRNETNGWVSLRCPPVSGTKSVPKTVTIFFKKKQFFLHVFFFFKKGVFFKTNRCVCYDSSFSLLTKGPTKQTENVRPTLQ